MDSETSATRITKNLWQILSIDPKNTPDHLKLDEIGMNSMFITDFQQALEKDYDIKLSQKEIRSLTIGMMKEFEAGDVDKLRKFAEKK